MITENLNKIDEILNLEIEQYKNLSELYDEKANFLSHSDTDGICAVDTKIKAQLDKIKELDAKRVTINNDFGNKDMTLSDYVKIAHDNNLALEHNLAGKKAEIFNLALEVSNKERKNIELINLGLKTVTKIINVIMNGAVKQSQYNSFGKNTSNDEIKISSFCEEV